MRPGIQIIGRHVPDLGEAVEDGRPDEVQQVRIAVTPLHHRQPEEHDSGQLGLDDKSAQWHLLCPIGRQQRHILDGNLNVLGLDLKVGPEALDDIADHEIELFARCAMRGHTMRRKGSGQGHGSALSATASVTHTTRSGSAHNAAEMVHAVSLTRVPPAVV